MEATVHEQPRLSRRMKRFLSRATGRQAAEGRLLSAAGGADIKTLLVTCARPGDGASTASLGLAHALAGSGLRTAWVDAHPSRPAYPRYVRGPSDGPGLGQWLAGETPLDRFPATADAPALLLCGQKVSLTEPNLRAADWAARLAEAKNNFDYVVVDAGDLRSGSWPAHCARLVDAVLVVASCRRTQEDDLDEAVQQLKHLEAHVLGVILNRKKRILPWWLDAHE